MKRRDAIKGSAAIFTVLGTIPGIIFNSGCTPSSDLPAWAANSFDELQGNVVRAGIDVLIPRSAAPSATDVKTHEFMDEMVTNIYSEERKTTFINAVNRLNALAIEKGSDFHELSAEDQNAVMLQFVDDQEGQERTGQFYSVFKRQTLNSYFKTEEVCTKVLNHIDVPGRYDACIDLKENQPLWAE